MNKPFQRGLGISSLLRSLAAFAVLFLAVGISQSHAQTFTTGTALSQKQIVQAQAPAGTNFLSSADAMLALKTEIGVLEDATPQSASEEVENSIKVEYYTLVLNSIAGGTGVGDAFNNSSQDLNTTLSRFDSTAPSFGAVRQSTLSLVSQ